MFISRIIQFSRATHQPERFIALPFSLRKPGGRGLKLNLDLSAPIVIAFDFSKRLPDGGQFLNLMWRIKCDAEFTAEAQRTLRLRREREREEPSDKLSALPLRSPRLCGGGTWGPCDIIFHAIQKQEVNLSMQRAILKRATPRLK
jgi:hypothetical protein